VEDLNNEEIKQLLNFYRQKSSDLEFQVLQSQIKINKLVANQIEPEPATKIKKIKSDS
jgi:hypothetical protein